jgi:WD40 repeat protein
LLPIWVGGYSPDGQTIITCGGTQSSLEEPANGGELIVWNLGTGRRRLLLRQPATIRSLAWSPEGKFVAVSDWRGETKLVDPVTGKVMAGLPPHTNLVNAVVVSVDGSIIVSAGIDGVIDVCDTTGKELDRRQVMNDRLLGLAISPDAKKIVATSKGGKAYLFDLAKPGDPQVLAAYGGRPIPTPRAETATFAADGKSFMTGCQHNLRLWDSTTGALLREFGSSPAVINKICFSPKGDKLASMGDDGTLTLWSVASGEQLNWKPAHPGGSHWVGFSPDGTKLATVGRKDLSVRIWDAESLDLVRAFPTNK